MDNKTTEFGELIIDDASSDITHAMSREDIAELECADYAELTAELEAHYAGVDDDNYLATQFNKNSRRMMQ